MGKSLRGERRAEEHRAVVSEIAGRERKVEVVLVAGDLFDTASPGPEAEEIVFHALLDLAQAPPNGSSSSGNHDNPRRLEAVEPLMRLRNIHVLAKVTARRGRCRPQDHGQDPSPAALGGHPGLQQHRWQAPQEARLRTSRRQQDALQRLRSRSRPPVPVHPVGPEAIRAPRAARHQRGHEEARDDRAVQECGRQVGPGRHPGVRPRYDHDFRTDAIGVAMCG